MNDEMYEFKTMHIYIYKSDITILWTWINDTASCACLSAFKGRPSPFVVIEKSQMKLSSEDHS